MDSRKDVFTSQILDILKSASLHLASAMERINAEEALKRHRYELEEKVRMRTMDVMESNNQLLREIEERRRTEEELLAQRNKLRALSAELLETEADWVTAIDLLAQLTDDQQEVVMLRFIGEMSLSEVAETLGKTIGATKATQHRALASLARLLERQGDS
jgi:RNA polymerase sigma factor (sigma-70 family)